MSDQHTGRSSQRPRIWLVETGPLGFALAWTLAADAGSWQLVAALVGAALASAGGLLSGVSWRAGNAVVTAGLAGLLAAIAPAMIARPLPALLVLLVSTGFLAAVWSPQTLGDLVGGLRARRLRADLRDVRLSAALALAVWLIGVALRAEVDPWLATASAIASVTAVARAAAWMRGVLEGVARTVWPAAVAIAVAVAAAAGIAGAIGTALVILALVPAGTLLLARARGVAIVDTGWAALILDHPARLIVATFLALCAIGTVLLSLPVCAGEAPIRGMDAAFTAVSAVCVTGLITVDTPTAWSGAGQAVILVLIQLGGLGIMTLSTAAMGALGRRLSVRHEEAVAGLFSGEHRGILFVALRRTLAVTFAAELAGAVCLSILFVSHGDGFGTAVWRGVFTAISAFCNAGFALQSDSLVGYREVPAVLHTVALLIIAGGLSPAVITMLPKLARRRRKAVPVQVKIILVTSAALLAVGFAAFAALEWNASLAGMSIVDRLHNAWFQSVTFRTAGFNSVDFAVLSAVTLPLACVLMFIGGSPGGTAGGVKVTTVWVLGSAVVGALRGQPEASSFGRRIPHLVVYRAIAISMISATMVMVVLTLIFLTQRLSGAEAVFEVFSAIGTVGLSLGGTSELDGLGKVVIMAGMFLGRVGPLSAFLLLVERRALGVREQLEENVEVG